MRRLVVNPGTPQAWEIQLKPGTTLIGRDPANDFQIEDAGISGSHCQILADDDSVVIRDLGSTNGTFVNQTQIQEAKLETGQTIRLGSAEMVYYCGESGAAADAEPAQRRVSATSPATQPAAPPFTVRVAPPAVAGPRFCKFHPKSPARYSCSRCNRAFCELCVNTRSTATTSKHTCRACGVECTALAASTQPQLERAPSFKQLLRGAFVYPLKADGIILLVAGGLFLLMLDGAAFVARFAFIYGKVALLFMTVFGTGYFVSYLRRILTSSAAGETKMPDWPELTDFGSDVLQPFLQFVGTVGFCFGPAIVLAVFSLSNSADSSWLGPLLIGLILLGCVYFPMAFMAVALFDSVMAVNPLLVVPSMLKIPLAYSFTIILFAFILTLRWLSGAFLSMVLPMGLPWVLSSFVGLYLATVEMRILGVLYWTKKSELGWFSR